MCRIVVSVLLPAGKNVPESAGHELFARSRAAKDQDRRECPLLVPCDETTLSPIPGVTAGTVTVTSPTTLTVQLTAASSAVTQPYSVLAITGAEEAVLPNGLVIQ